MDINIEEVLTELGRHVAINSHLSRRVAKLEQNEQPYETAKIVIKEMGKLLDEFEELIDDVRFSGFTSDARMADLQRNANDKRGLLKVFDEKYPGVRFLGLFEGNE